MPLLPIRARVLHYMSTTDQTDVNDVMENLKAEYGSERQFTKANFVDHFLSLMANGLIDEVDYTTDENNELLITYAINEEGKNTVNKYLPKKYRTKA